MITWLLIAVLSAVAVGAMFVGVSVGELLARRDVPIPGEQPTWLQRAIEHVRSGARRARAAYWQYLRGRRSP